MLMNVSRIVARTIKPVQACRMASHRANTNTKNSSNKGNPKHRGWKRQDGCIVPKGCVLATQNQLRWHPGLNVGFGRTGELYALVPGLVSVTCERVNLNWQHTWVERCHGTRTIKSFFKKYFNVIPNPQHQNFRLITRL